MSARDERSELCDEDPEPSPPVQHSAASITYCARSPIAVSAGDADDTVDL